MSASNFVDFLNIRILLVLRSKIRAPQGEERICHPYYINSLKIIIEQFKRKVYDVLGKNIFPKRHKLFKTYVVW